MLEIATSDTQGVKRKLHHKLDNIITLFFNIKINMKLWVYFHKPDKGVLAGNGQGLVCGNLTPNRTDQIGLIYVNLNRNIIKIVRANQM